MIAPRPDLTPQDERPPIDLSHWMRAIGLVAGPVLRPLLHRRYLNAQRRLSELISRASACRTRHELESLLGSPEYAMNGTNYVLSRPDGSTWSPEVVEVYCHRRCVVEIQYESGVIRSVLGWPQWTAWDLAANLPDYLHGESCERRLTDAEVGEAPPREP